MKQNAVLEPDTSATSPVIGVARRHGLDIDSHRWLLLTLVAAAVVAAVVAFLLLGHRASPVVSADDGRLRQLVARNDCSASAEASVSKLRPSTGAPAASLDLYRYRVTCLVLSNQLSAASSQLNQERQFALRVHDPATAANAAEELANVRATLQQSGNEGVTR